MMAWSRPAAILLVFLSILIAPHSHACSDCLGGIDICCGHGDSPAPRVSLPPPEPGVVDIAMVDYIFSPDVVEVTPGTVVRWTNLDAEPHDTVSYDAKWQSEYLETGGSFEYLFTDDSFQDFNYFCSLHGGMAGTVTVVAPEPAGLALLGWAILAALRRSRPTSAFLSPSCFCV